MTPEVADQLVRIAEHLKADATERKRLLALREQLVLQAHRDGASLREIAKAAGVTHVVVVRILRRNT